MRDRVAQPSAGPSSPASSTLSGPRRTWQPPGGRGRYTAASHQDLPEGDARVVKVVILAGGLGTRLSEETASRPKPMVEIGERPILWHIMKIYSHYGFNDFVVCLGYKGYVIKEYFSNYFLHMSDVTFDMRDNSMVVHQNAGRAVARDAGRHGRRDADRRADQARPRLHRRRDVHADLRRRRRGRRHRPAGRVPPCARQARDDHGGPADRAASDPSRSTTTRSSAGSWRLASEPSRRSRSATAPG